MRESRGARACARWQEPCICGADVAAFAVNADTPLFERLPMRKLVFVFAPAALALVTLMACENDSPSGPAGPTFDAGLPDWNAPPTTFEGGPTPDAAPDAPAVPSVSVTVTGASGPKAGVRVVFHDATGAVLDTKLTGSDGKATHTGTTPSMASALVQAGTKRRIVTWTGVEDGDDLQLRAEETDELVGMYSVTFSSMPDGGASMFAVEGPCGDNMSYGTAAELPMYRFCSRPQNAFLATARTFSGTLVGHAFKKGNTAITDGGTGAITLGGWQAPSTFSLTAANVPAEVEFDTELLEIADGAGYRTRWGDSEGTTVSYRTAAGFADAYQASFWVGFDDIERAITKRVANDVTNVAFDYADLLPAIEDAFVDATNPRRPVVSWTPAASTANIDGGLVHFTFSRPDDEGTYTWTFVVSPSATSVTAPAMPVEAESFLPPPPDAGVSTSFWGPKVLLVEADVLPGYAAFRGQQGTLLDATVADIWMRALPALPIDGTFRTTSYAQLPR